MTRFQGKSFVVTGGSSGIGLATAKRILDDGGRVAITGRNQATLDAAQEQAPGVLAIQNDAADPEAATSLAAQLKDAFGRIDGAFLNAGFGRYGAVEELTAKDVDEQFAANVRGPVLQAGALSPLLNDGGAILITTSVAQHMGLPGGSIYGGSKAAVRAIVRSLARDFAPRNIRVNGISPGPIETGFFDRANVPADQHADIVAQTIAMTPLGRFGSPEEVANVATFLMSGEASFVTAADITVDGGICMH